ncbi:hypothetical protein Pcinc_027481 [Petrolisthes cinctipes]|uniref:Uncharacterized protein n=1 Tax=Petrolisthes cinctipes TaxID=88211 RepID=A0AAE1KA77_PETCI|nr:hypothetical protein Pcinc_037629 [Petrolisthes cinctipes]KAK3867023.1 hypothetical protein Pcinc_027481 [Petrolisthes cinctipes]
MSGDLQTRKRKGKGKKKGHLQVVKQQETEPDQTAHRVVPCKMHTLFFILTLSEQLLHTHANFNISHPLTSASCCICRLTSHFC